MAKKSKKEINPGAKITMMRDGAVVYAVVTAVTKDGVTAAPINGNDIAVDHDQYEAAE